MNERHLAARMVVSWYPMQDYHIAVCSYYQSLGHDVRVEWKQSIILTLILADLSVPIPTLVEGMYLGPRAIEIDGRRLLTACQ